MFELQIVRPVEGLEALGDDVALCELSYGQMRAVMHTAQAAGRAGEALLGAALQVNGEPFGVEALDALPGRFAGAIARAMARCLEMHGMTTAAPAEASSGDAPAGEA